GEFMAGVWNVNSVYNSMQKKLSGKISFQIGELISARLISKGEDGKSVIVRTLDGWQFPALLEEPLEFLPDMLTRMQVSGYEDGKLKLKPVGQKHYEEALKEESISEIARNNNLKEEDMDLLKAMIKYSVPLTRDNISRIKSLVSFMDKINNDAGELPQFISRYLAGKGLSPDSEKGQEVQMVLKDFFEELKTLSVDDLLTMEENDIELSAENIASYKNIFKETGGIFKSLEKLQDTLSKYTEVPVEYIDDIPEDEKSLQMTKDNYSVKPDEEASEAGIAPKADEAGRAGQNAKVSDLKSLLTEAIKVKVSTLPLGEKTVLEKQISRLPLDSLASVIERHVNSIEGGEHPKGQAVVEKKVRQALEIFIGPDITFEDGDVKEIIRSVKSKGEKSNLNVRDVNDEGNSVSLEVRQKLEEVKNLIKSVINMRDSIEDTAWKALAENVKANISDIKTFNSVSGQYYYMDMPLKLYEKEYPCKLIIKDDRKKGKRIDSTNVKMALSITTGNMGTVDAYVAVRDKNMKVDFKCEDGSMRILDMSKEKLWKILDKSGYNINIEVHKREAPMDIASCRDFFDESQSFNINIKV
ncbi:MAG: hypothetical protein Q8930_17940, partial [Bacillota bacterium]|nr:hypothetical protein [Bacillota bacterium]